MRTEWANNDVISHILAALTKENRLACIVSLTTGLRISDVLSLKTNQLKRNVSGNLRIWEQKTGKKRNIRLAPTLYKQLYGIAGQVYVFEHRLTWKKHRTRQAVFNDIKRAAKAFRVDVNLAPHSMRKAYAVGEYHKSGSIKRVQELLNHDNEAVTIIYAMADSLNHAKKGSEPQET